VSTVAFPGESYGFEVAPRVAYSMVQQQGSSFGQILQANRLNVELVAANTAKMVVTSIYGDYRKVMASALTHHTLRSWARSQNWQASLPMAGVGALTAAYPKLAMPASLTGTLWLTRRMAHTVWGTGAILSCEVDPFTDLINVWVLMSGLSPQQLQESELRAGRIVYTQWRKMLQLGDQHNMQLQIDSALAMATVVLQRFGREGRLRLAYQLLDLVNKAKPVLVPATGAVMAGVSTAIAMKATADSAATYYRHR
jgi:hypothetical protein